MFVSVVVDAVKGAASEVMLAPMGVAPVLPLAVTRLDVPLALVLTAARDSGPVPTGYDVAGWSVPEPVP